MKPPAEHCGYCGAPIFWATTPTGRAMPLDYEPTDGGNVRIFDGPNGMLCVVTAPAMIPLGMRHTSHFATCPKADQARRKRQ